MAARMATVRVIVNLPETEFPELFEFALFN